jgi:hypothetical protein
MTIHRKAWITAVLAVFMLTLAVGAASALRSLSISGATTLTLNTRWRLASEFATIECNMTITKTVSRVIPKVDHILIGKITRVVTGRAPEANCRSSSGTLSNIEIRGLEREENGRILKGVILGTLPNITGILVLIDRLQVSFTTELSGRCGYESPERGIPELAEVNRGTLGRLRLEANRLVRLEGGIFCPRTGEWIGDLTPLQTTGVTLV